MTKKRWSRGAVRSFLLVPILCMIGCVSTDPSKDVGQAASLIEARTGLKPEWHIPWVADTDTWDGHSKLTAAQAVIVALRNNRSIQSRLEDIAGTRADLVQSGLLPNPVVNLAYGFPLGGGAGGATLGAGVVQDFTALWLRPAHTRSATALLQAEILGVSNDALHLVADVKQAHARVAFGDRAATLLLSEIDLAKQAIDVTQRKVAAGEASQLDVNRNQLLFLNLQSQFIDRRATLAKEKRQLLLLIGRSDLSSEFDVDGSAWSTDALNLTESQVIALAREQRLDVAAAQFIYQSRADELQLDKLGGLPTVALGAHFQRENDGGKELGPEADITVPLFDQNQAKTAKARSNLRKAALDADRTLQEAIGQARLAWADWQANLSQIQLYQDQLLKLAKENLELSDKARKAGTVDQTVFLEAQRDLISAQSSLLDLERDAILNQIELEFAVGGTLQPLIKQAP